MKLTSLLNRLNSATARFVLPRSIVSVSSGATLSQAPSIFDANWYLETNQDVKNAGYDPAVHFTQYGYFEGRSPSPLFDTDFYKRRNPDISGHGLAPIWHYLQYGATEGRAPNAYFDAKFYRASHTGDTDAQVDPLAHYLAHARVPGHHPSPFFDNDWYAERYLASEPDVVPLTHFIKNGEALGLKPHPLYDEQLYLDINRDVGRLVSVGILPSGFNHFVNHGVEEIEAGHYRHFRFEWGAHSLDYDPIVYRADNPDVDQAISSGRVRNGLEHLFAYGWREGMEGLRAIYGKRHSVRLVRSITGDAPKAVGKYLCLFAHYDRDDLIDPYVVSYLKALRRMDVDIVFITATADDKQLSEIRPLISKILIKNEAGRDFGSWWLALHTLGLDCGAAYHRVIFANDSIYFPVRPVEPLFADMESKNYNLYGMSDSQEMDCYHLQSFFLSFDTKAQKAIFPTFAKNFKRNYVLTKWGQIREYELGLTQIAQRAGLSVGAFFSSADAREDVIREPRLARWKTMRGGLNHLNPTHDLWDLIIGEYGWPGLKLELLRDNPKQASGFEKLPRLIADGNVPFEVIEAHQKRSREPGIIVRSHHDSVPPPLSLVKRLSGRSKIGARRMVLFAHYDPDGEIDPHIIFQVKSLQEANCSVVFITSICDEEKLKVIYPFVRDVLVKTDSGRDFGSWYIALQTLGHEVQAFETVIWMNDSTYFPLFDPEPMFVKMEKQKADFWGVVDSFNGGWHAMSWFWAFGRRAIEAGWFEWYKNEYNSAHTKWAQIRNYEMRMPGLIRASGLTTCAYIQATDVQKHILQTADAHPRMDAAQRGDFSMTHDFWREIITDFRCPALKVELVRDNPLGIDLSTLLSVIGEHTDFDPDLIRRHMLRLKTAHLSPPARAELG